MVPTRGAGVTAAAGTSLAHHLFAKGFNLGKSLTKVRHLESPYHTFVHCKVSRLLHPVGLGPVFQ